MTATFDKTENDRDPASRMAATGRRLPILSGLHEIEPDAAERGVWVESLLRIPIPNPLEETISLTGFYFPKLIAAQHGTAEMELCISVNGRPAHTLKLTQHGFFSATFSAGEVSPGHYAELAMASDRFFVPAQIGDGNDQRELCWRLISVSIGQLSVIDWSQRLSFMLFPGDAIPDAHDAPSSKRAQLPETVRYHLDTPRPGFSTQDEGGLLVSGWACDVASRRALAVRVMLSSGIHKAALRPRQDVQSALAAVAALPLETGFALTLQLSTGMHQIRVVAQADSGDPITLLQGYLLSAPPPRRLPAGRLGDWIARGLPKALVSRALDHLRVLQRDPAALALPGSYHFHLDVPQVEQMNVIHSDFIISGWAFDEDARSTMPVRIVVGDKIHIAHTKQREDVQKAFLAAGPVPLQTGFACILNLPVGLHSARIEVRTHHGDWIQVRRVKLLRVPALFRQNRAAPQRTLRTYLKAKQKFQQLELPEVRRHIETMLQRPRFTVLIESPNFDAKLKSTISAIRSQIYSNVDIRIRSTRTIKSIPSWASPAALSVGKGIPEDAADYLLLLRSGDQLEPRALYEFASAINQDSAVDLIYADEIHDTGRRAPPVPFHKPDWSPDYLETFNYIGFAACFRTATARSCVEEDKPINGYDLALRITERSRRIQHLPVILGRRTLPVKADPACIADDISALSERLTRTGRVGTVREHDQHKGCYVVALTLQHQPLVSIIIPTAGKTIMLEARKIDLLSNVLTQIFGRSTYSNFEIVIIDNGDLSMTQLELLRQHNCKRITYTEPVFNISKKLNLGATLAAGAYFLLMNDDIEILTPDWIERMLEHFEKLHVGVVGAKLLYPDGKTQHVGVVHNSGNPDHVRRLFARDDAGYYFSTCGVRNYGAVTGACMMTPAPLYRQVGGYSEELAVSYNDADYCLKIAQLGRSIVYAPAAELIHMESQSRVASADPVETAWYHTRWAPFIVSDPYYNERFLTVASPTFVPCINERLV